VSLENQREPGSNAGPSILSGFFLLDKVEGHSSQKALYPLKRSFKGNKVGHAGTLDPDATGLLVVAVGSSTKLLQYAEGWDKTYKFDIHFGIHTDTLDTSGEILEKQDFNPSEESLKEILASFLGEQMQMPPVYSAIKIDGKRACDRARKGQVVELKPRPVKINTLEFLSLENNIATLRTVCSKGTYVRSLGRDIAKSLGGIGAVAKIRREAIGLCKVEGAPDSEEIRPDGVSAGSLISPHHFVEFPKIEVDSKKLELMSYGQTVQVDKTFAEGFYWVSGVGLDAPSYLANLNYRGLKAKVHM
jgi:tRNA pseudouridine55 synthase